MFVNESSPSFSVTHWIPFGEKMENPDDEPVEIVSMIPAAV